MSRTEGEYAALAAFCIGAPWTFGIMTGRWDTMCALLLVGLVLTATTGFCILRKED